MKYPQHIFPKGLLTLRIINELNKRSLCGDELANIIGMRRGSKLTPGTIYPALKFLRRKKLVSMKKNGRKKHYSLTPNGKKEYAALRKNFMEMFGTIFKK